MADEWQQPAPGFNEQANSATNSAAESLTPVDGWIKRTGVDYTTFSNQENPTWEAQNTKRQVWKEEYGDVAPRDEELELDLFGDPLNRVRTGMDFSKIAEIKVVQEGPVEISPIASFKDAGLHPAIIENIALAGYTAPTPIQKFTIPAMLQGNDVIGSAQTGSGKTAAYLLPILSKLMGKAKKWAAPRPNPATYNPDFDGVRAEPLVLVVVPTRELAVQIFKEALKFSYRSMLRPCVVYGGPRVMDSIADLQQGCDVLIGTPGRLIDLMHRTDILSFCRLRYAVVDEADEMLHGDWENDLNMILSGGEQDEGNMIFCMFSATFPKELRDLAKKYLNASHVRLRVGRAGSTTENIKQQVIEAESVTKRDALLDLLKRMAGYRTIIFVNRRMEVDNLDDFLFNVGLPVTSMHSDRTQLEREHALRCFRAGTSPILIATGVMARGIDVQNVQHVINYDLPTIDHGGIEEYIHRIGRTGRIGNRGVASSFFTPDDDALGSVLARTLLETNQEIPDFLRHYLPEGVSRDNVKFETESDFDETEQAAAGEANAWGSGGDTAGGTSGTSGGGDFGGGPPADSTNNGGSAWGSAPPVSATAEVIQPDAWGAAVNSPPSAPMPPAAAAPVSDANGWGAAAAPPSNAPMSVAAAAPVSNVNGWGVAAAPPFSGPMPPPAAAPVSNANGWGVSAAPPSNAPPPPPAAAPARSANDWSAVAAALPTAPVPAATTATPVSNAGAWGAYEQSASGWKDSGTWDATAAVDNAAW